MQIPNCGHRRFELKGTPEQASRIGHGGGAWTRALRLGLAAEPDDPAANKENFQRCPGAFVRRAARGVP